MTRLLFVDEDLVILLETDLTPTALLEAVQAGNWQPPPALGRILAHGLPAGADSVSLRAVRLGGLVILSPAEALESAGKASLEGLQPVSLSPRQRQVLQDLADGLSNKQIAAHLGLHRRTVDLHVAKIKNHFGTTSRMQSVMRGAALGLCKLRSNARRNADIEYTWPSTRGPSRSRPPRKKDEERSLPDSADE